MARICVLAPHMWGRRVALHPLQSPAKLINGAKIDFICNFGYLTADYIGKSCIL